MWQFALLACLVLNFSCISANKYNKILFAFYLLLLKTFVSKFKSENKSFFFTIPGLVQFIDRIITLLMPNKAF